MPCFSPSCSQASPSETVHSGLIRGLTSRQPSAVDTAVTLPAGNGLSGLGSTQGALVIDSTPPVTTTSASPVSIIRDAPIAASRLDPQSRFTVEPGTETGSPASSTAIRPTLRFSSPAPLALPSTTSATAAGSSPGERSSSVRTANAARSSGRDCASAPPRRPNGVRTAS